MKWMKLNCVCPVCETKLPTIEVSFVAVTVKKKDLPK